MKKKKSTPQQNRRRYVLKLHDLQSIICQLNIEAKEREALIKELRHDLKYQQDKNSALQKVLPEMVQGKIMIEDRRKGPRK